MLAPLAAAAAALLLAACGGDGDGGGYGSDRDYDPGGSALSKQDFLAQAGEICQSREREIDAAAEEEFGDLSGERPSDEQLEQYATEVIVPQVQAQIDEIAELNPPEADRDEVEAIVSAAQDGVDEIEEDPSRLGDPEANPFGEANSLARAYGLKACGG